MKFGVRFVQHIGSVRDIIELAVLAEEVGFDYVWLPHDAFMKNTLVLASAVAERTARIQIGTVGTNAYMLNPAELATFAATLDELSGGRAVLGLGLHTRDMVEWAGLDAGDIITHTREAVEIVRALLRGEVVAYQGAAFQWTEQCYLRFQPFRPDIPIYVAAFGPDYLALSGAIGDGSLPMITPPESAAYMVASIIAGAQRAGRDPAHIDIAGCTWLSLAENRQEAAATLRPIIAYFAPYLEDNALATIGLSTNDFASLKQLLDAGRYDAAAQNVTDAMLRLAIVGTPADAIERIEQLAAAGVTHVNLGGPLGPDPATAIRLLGAKVIPYFR